MEKLMSENQSKAGGVGSTIINLIVFVVILGIAAKTLIIPFVFPGFHLGETTLEHTLKIGVATKNDSVNFKDNGGLNTESNWKRFHVSSMQTSYNKNVLSAFEITVDKQYPSNKPATNNSLKEALLSDCGSEWNGVDNNSVSVVYSKDNKCMIMDQQSTFDVAIGVNKILGAE
jgi:Tfp pilus assembly protein PilE